MKLNLFIFFFIFFLMIRRPPRSTPLYSSAASDVYKRQPIAAGVLYPFLGIVLSPMIAAAAMSLSSVSVIGNALRLKGVKLQSFPFSKSFCLLYTSPSPETKANLVCRLLLEKKKKKTKRKKKKKKIRTINIRKKCK